MSSTENSVGGQLERELEIMARIAKSLLSKDLPLKLQDPSVKSRVNLLTAIKDSLSVPNENISEEESVPAELAAKSLAKILPSLVFPRYLDSKSRIATLQLVEVLLDKHAETTCKVFAASLFDNFSSWTNIVPSIYLVRIAIFALQWISLIIDSASKKE